jgi:hypothetical protein
MNKRFTAKELYLIRNAINLPILLQTLGIPCKEVEGFYRFICPDCCEMRTAINPKTNLGRCFRCNKNFNTIEISMKTWRLGFVDTVKQLKQLFPNLY